jgi:hypothetical protein
MGAININGTEKYAVLSEKTVMYTTISLWNKVLEIHTGRIYHSIIGDLYVLIVPLTGLVVFLYQIQSL